jgi:hypothetical protein
MLTKFGFTIPVEVITTLRISRSAIPSSISLLSSVRAGGGIQGLSCDEGNRGFLLSYVPLILSAYISSIIPTMLQ